MSEEGVPSAHKVRKRSVRIAGHRTSVSLEDAFWSELTRIAEVRGQSINALIATIDAGRGGNLSSAVRVFILNEVRQANGLNEVRQAGR
jgi:predicted DNA-binding ribbon-helix-helix protein